MKPALTLCLAMVLGLSACGDLKLRKMKSDDKGPEEFTVLPVKHLQEPSDYKVLPEPNSAAGNLVDATPKADAIVALGQLRRTAGRSHRRTTGPAPLGCSVHGDGDAKGLLRRTRTVAKLGDERPAAQRLSHR